MATISVLTAAQSSRSHFLKEAGDSVARQELPPGWLLEWVVQEDGDNPSLAADIGRFPFARYEPNRQQLGVGHTRNLALSRADGELIHVLDSDDLLLPDALGTAIAAFVRYPKIHWVSGQADDLLPGGQRVSVALPIEPGLIEPGRFSNYICERHTPHLPVHTAGLTIRTATTRALGGWGGYPRAEDSHLLAALAEMAAGYLPATVTWLYRKHPGQMTASGDWQDLGLHIAIQRIAAIREAHLGGFRI